MEGDWVADQFCHSIKPLQGLPCLLTSSHFYGHAAQVGKEGHASMQRPAAYLDRPDGSQG